MSYAQPRLGATQFRFSQQPSQPIIISSLPRTRLNGTVQGMVTSQKSVPNSVTQIAETKRLVADREIIVLSSDSDSDTETRPVVSREIKGKEKENISYVKGMRNKKLDSSALMIVDQHNSDVNKSSTVDKDNRQRKVIDSLSNNTKSTHESTNKRNLLNDYKSVQSNKEKLSLSQIASLKETGEIIKGLERTHLHDEGKRRNGQEENSQESKRRKQGDDVDGGERLKKQDRHERQKRREQLKSYEEKRLRDEKESVRKGWQELEKQMKSQVNNIPSSRRLDHSSMPAPSQFNNIRPREKTGGEAEFVNLLAEPLHELITTQLVYDSYKDFAPFHLSQTVGKCTVNKIFRLNRSEREEYCKQLYRQYINTSMKSTTSALESWIKTRISETARPYLSSRKR